MELKFYKQNNELVYSYDELDLEKVVANTVDAAKEKHVPVFKLEGNKVLVKVGEVTHPMLENHYITFILLETNKGLYKKELKPGEEPEANFELQEGEKFLAVYEHCNLHGLWKAC